MTGIDKKDQTKIIRVIEALIPEAKIYLFGSRARSTHQDRADIDIAIDAGKRLERVDVGEIRDMLNESNISLKIDVVDLHNIPEEMKTAILEEGIVWKE